MFNEKRAPILMLFNYDGLTSQWYFFVNVNVEYTFYVRTRYGVVVARHRSRIQFGWSFGRSDEITFSIKIQAIANGKGKNNK